MAHEARESYSGLVLAKLRKEMVLKDGVVFNNDYEGDPKAGVVKIPVRDTEVTAGNYNKATGIAPGTGTTQYVSLPITEDVAINEIIDGYDAEVVPDGIVAERLDSGAYALQSALDSRGASCLLSQGTAIGIGSQTKDTIYDALVDQRKAHIKANIPNDGKRFLLATPDGYALLLKSPMFTKASDLGDAVQQTGAIGRIAGYNVFEMNDDTANLAFILGHPRFATRVHAFSVPPKVVSLDGDSQYIGASAVKGRMCFGHKVLRAAAVRAVYMPSVLTVACAAATGASDSGKTVATVTGATGTLKYRVNPTVRAAYGDDGTAAGYTSLTSGTTKITAAAGAVIEVVELDSDSKVIAVGYGVSVPMA